MNNRRSVIMKFAVAIILLAVAYFPTLRWMFDRWMAHESYYGHGFLIPMISLYVIWQRRSLLKKSSFSTYMPGLAIIACGLLIHVISAALRVYFISGFSFVFVLYGLILFLFGKKIAGKLVFPVFFLLAMIPLPLVLIGNLTVKLKLFVAETATFTLNRIGFPSIRDGSIIRMPHSFTVVAAPCSGLRSLIALLTLGIIFSFIIKMSYLRKAVLFLSSIPIALTVNIIRVVMLATVNDLYGEKVAMGFFHDFTGFAMFGFAFTGLYMVSKALDKNE